MRIQQVSVGKEMKVGLPNFSNISVRCDIQFEVAEGEQMDWDTAWDEVNQQLSIQAGGIDPSWMVTKEYKNYFKTTIKSSKGTI